MAKRKYEGAAEYRPISAWGYVGYSLLFLIPVIGFILMIVFACGSRKINRRNYARSRLCWLLLALILIGGAVFMASRSAEVQAWLERNLPQIQSVMDAAGVKASPSASGRASVPAAATEPPRNGVIRDDIRSAIDELEAFFQEYADFMSRYRTGNTAAMALEYSRMLVRLAENREKWDRFDSANELSDAEEAYLAAAAVRINGYLQDAAQ